MLSLLLPFVAVPSALAADVVTVANPGGQVGPTNVAYSKSMTATGGTAPYVWSALSLPPGLSIDTGTGLISGTPTTAGNYTTKVTATDTAGTAGTAQFSFATGVIVTYPSSRGAKTGVPITPWTLKAAGGTGTFTWTATGLPTGLSIDANTGTVSGTPTADGTTTVMATATDTAGKSGATSFPWTVGPGATVTDPGTLHATTGVGLSKQLNATGGTTAYSWSATGLPAGLSIKSNTGVISGTPTTAGTSSVQVTVTDAAKIPTTITVPIVVAAPVAVTTPATRTDVTGTATSLSLAAAGGVAPYTWSATGLPSGMTLNPGTGVISGTPSSAATLTVNVTATDAGQRTNTVSFGWNISGPITVASVYGQVGPTGVAYSKTLTASGGTAPYSWAATGLPTGLSINANTGVISGTPTAAGNYTVKVTVTDKDGLTGATSFPFATGVIVTYPTEQGSANGTPITALVIKAAGGSGTYTWTASGLPTGLSIDAATGTVSGTPTADGAYTAVVTATDGSGTSGATSFAWTIAAAPALPNPGTVHATTGIAMSHQLTATGGKAPYSWLVTGLPAGLSKSNTGLISGTPTTAGTTTLTVTVIDALKITNTVTFPLTVGTPVTAVSPGTRNNTAGTAISNLPLTTDGGTGPYTWSVTGLPDGLTATTAGVISGTPTTAANATVTATVVDAAGRTATTSFTWTIAGPVTITDPGTQAGTVGAAATLTFAATGGAGAFHWTATGLPTGLTLDTTTGIVSGTPTTEGSWTAAVTATDTNGATASLSVAWTVATAVAAITPTTQTSVAGTAVTLTLAAGGGTAPYTWTATGLPDGLSLDPSTGIVTGTPTAATAGSTVTATVTDTAGRTDQTSFTWTVTLTAPIALTATPDGPQTVQLTWAAVDGAAAYRIYRDGTRLTDTGAITALRDSQLDGATTYQYRIAALSGEGLETATSPATTVTTLATPAAPENYTTCFTSEPRGCTYTVSVPADATHPDAGRELTDGIHGTLDAGSAWQGRRPNNQYTITVDLGASRPLTEINSSWLQKQSQGIALPLTVAYAFSNDGTNFTDLALITRPYVTDTDQIKTYRAAGLAETARYVRVTVNGSSGWTLLDEIELRGVITGIQPALTLPTPAAAANDQGQQITALPLTVTESAGPLTWTADGLPPGLTIGRTSGVITGTVRTPGTYTVTATATSASGRTGRTSFLWKVYASPATGPVMDSGKVTGLGPAVNSGGVAVLDGFAYTVVGSKVVKYDLTAGTLATAQTVAGGDSNGCNEAGSGGQARFYAGARVIGTDGSLIYVADTSCGLKAVTPSTGASRTISARFNTESTIAGRYLYTLDTSKQIWRYDLQAGQTTRLFESASLYGALAADNDALWVFNNSDVKLYRLAFNSTETKTFPLPMASVTATRSVGDFIYYTDYRNLLTRISKTDGSLQIVAGDGANGDLLYSTTGIATDGTNLYTAGNQGLAKLTTTPRLFTPPASSPILDSGKVTGFGSAVSSGGVAVLDGFAYTVVGSKVVKYDLTAGTTATAQTVAGGDNNACTEGSGGQARFYAGARVIGTDGSLIYVADTSCGLKAVTPSTGASRTISARFNTESTIAGRYLYTLDNFKNIWRYDLQAGQTTRLFENLSLYGAIAADNDALWVFNNSDVKLYRLAFNSTETKTYPLPAGGVTAARSAGDYIYYTDSRNLLSRISKTDGTLRMVAGDAARTGKLLSNTTGIATDGTFVLTSGEPGLAKVASIVRTFARPATGPNLGSGKVTQYGPDSYASGVTILNGYAYVGMGYKLVRYNLNAGPDAPLENIAGSDTPGCVDADKGDLVRFNQAHVITNDTEKIYVTDPSCGLRSVNAKTGATRRIGDPVGRNSVVVNNRLYSADNYGKIWQYDLESGDSPRKFVDASFNGPIAADDDYLWAFNGSGKLYGLALDRRKNSDRDFAMPSNAVFAALSVGEFIYFVDGRHLLSRINKNDGSLQIVAGDGALNDDLLYITMGIAADGTNIYTAGDHGLYVINAQSREFIPQISEGPSLGAGTVQKTVTSSLPGEQWGIAIANNQLAFTASGTRVSATATQTGEIVPVAGGANRGCTDGKGTEVTFYNTSVVGTDGLLVYVFDSGCGLRAINPYTGSTRTLRAHVNEQSSIAGEYLYTIDASNGTSTLYQYGLKSGVTNIVQRGVASGSLMAGQIANQQFGGASEGAEAVVWLINGQKLDRVGVSDAEGKQVDRDLGFPLGTAYVLYKAIGTHATFNGGYLYYLSSAVIAAPAPDTGVVPAWRITRTDRFGNTQLLGGAWPSVTRGIVATRNDVYALSATNGSTSIERIHEPEIEDPEFEVDLSLYVEEGTRFVPKGDEEYAWYLPGGGPRLVWDPNTGLCVEGCQGIAFLARQLEAQQDPSLVEDLCYIGTGNLDCITPESWERGIVHHFVDEAGFYDHEGKLLPAKRIQLLQYECGQTGSDEPECNDQSTLDKIIENAETIAEVVEAVLDLIEPGTRPDDECTDSFRAGTQVLMADGSTTAIQDIRLGQQVLAADPVSQAAAGQSVTAVHVNTDTELTDLTLTDGSVVHTTAHHPFWVTDLRQWIDAEDLVAGVNLSSTNGRTVMVKSVYNFIGSMTMYNLTVENLHTYYVLAGNEPILVHNGNCLGVRFKVPTRPGVYIIKFKDGKVYIGSAERSMRTRVNRAGDLAKPNDRMHALEKFGYSHEDVVEVEVREIEPTFGRTISRDTATEAEQAVMDEFMANGVTLINQDYPVVRVGLEQPRHQAGSDWIENVVLRLLPNWTHKRTK